MLVQFVAHITNHFESIATEYALVIVLFVPYTHSGFFFFISSEFAKLIEKMCCFANHV